MTWPVFATNRVLVCLNVGATSAFLDKAVAPVAAGAYLVLSVVLFMVPWPWATVPRGSKGTEKTQGDSQYVDP